MQDLRFVLSPYVCMQVIPIPSPYVFLSIPTILHISYLLKYISYLQQLTICIELAEDFFSWKSVARGWSVTPIFWGKTPLPPPPPQKNPASAAKPISACLYKTLTLMLYNLVNHPNLMGARRSCSQFPADRNVTLDVTFLKNQVARYCLCYCYHWIWIVTVIFVLRVIRRKAIGKEVPLSCN